MGNQLHLDYDELKRIAMEMFNKGNDILTLYGKTIEKTHDLKVEWIGEGAQAFFDEMLNEIVPALTRLANALFAAQDTLLRIIRIIGDADLESASLFKGEVNNSAASRPGGINSQGVSVRGGTGSAFHGGGGPLPEEEEVAL